MSTSSTTRNIHKYQETKTPIMLDHQKKKKPILKEAGSEHFVNNTQHFTFYTQTKTKRILKCSN